MLKKAIFAVAVSSALAFSAQAAQTIDFSSPASLVFPGIGADAPGIEFDALYYDGVTETGFDVSTPVDFVVAEMALLAGPNCDEGITCVSGQLFDRSVDFTVNGVTKALVLSFRWDISAVADSVTFFKPASLSFDLSAGSKLSIDFMTPDALVVPAGLEWSERQPLTAKFSVTPAVPEASTYAMLVGGLGMVGLMARRKRQVAA